MKDWQREIIELELGIKIEKEMKEVDSDLVRTIRMNGRNQMKGEMIRWLDTHPKATALDLVKHFCGTIWMSGSLEDGRYKEGQNFNP